MQLILTTILLGIASFDPLGTIFIMMGLSRGVKKKQVYLFSITTLVFTILFGVVLVLLTRSGIDYFSNMFNGITDRGFVIIYFIIAILCLIWFFRGLFKNNDKNRKVKRNHGF